MNIIKKVVVFVMGLVVIGVVATTIGVVTQPKNVEKSVTFELLENNELAFNVYDVINDYAVFESDGVGRLRAINVIGILVNGDDSIFTDVVVSLNYNNSIGIIDPIAGEPDFIIFDNNTYLIQEYGDLSEHDIITLTFAVEVKTPVIIKTLLLLTPLILSASLIGYLSLTVRSGKNE